MGGVAVAAEGLLGELFVRLGQIQGGVVGFVAEALEFFHPVGSGLAGGKCPILAMVVPVVWAELLGGGPVFVGQIRIAGKVKMDGEFEIGVGEIVIRVGFGGAGGFRARRLGESTLVTLGDPISKADHIIVAGHFDGEEGDVFGIGDFVGADDSALFVDPDADGNVDHLI